MPTLVTFSDQIIQCQQIVNFADNTNDKDITNDVDDIYDYDKVYYGKFITNVDDIELKTFLRPLLPPGKPGGGRIPVE